MAGTIVLTTAGAWSVPDPLSLAIDTAGALTIAGQTVTASVGGDFVHGETVVLTPDMFGLSDFGSDPNMRLFDTVTNQSAYSALTSGDTIPAGGSNPWQVNGYISGKENRVKYNTAESVGRHSYDTARYYAAVQGTLNNPTAMNGDHGYSHLFASFWLRLTGEWYGATKIVRIWGGGDSQAELYLSWNQDHYYGAGAATYWEDTPIRDGLWTRYAVWTDRRTASSAVTKLYKSATSGGVLAQHGSSGVTENSTGWESPVLQTVGVDWGGEPSVPPDDFYMTDIYVAGSPKRFEIADNATLSSATVAEVQEIVSWSSSSVTIRVFAGAIASLSGKYVHFIDENNAVSGTAHLVS